MLCHTTFCYNTCNIPYYHTISHCTTPHYTTPRFTTYTIPHHTILYHTILHHTTPHCTTPYYTTPRHIVPHLTTPCTPHLHSCQILTMTSIQHKHLLKQSMPGYTTRDALPRNPKMPNSPCELLCINSYLVA